MSFRNLAIGIVCLLMAAAGPMAAQQYKSNGTASYYGKKAHGRRTSSGERFDMNAMTCAHRTLPFGTLLNVRDVKTGKEVQVRVTDRGPFAKGRIVDLSYAAAKELGIVQRGLAQVEVTLAAPKAESTEEMRIWKGYLLEMQLFDPATGQYYTTSEWTERAKQAEREAALAKAQLQQPHWKILNERLTAKAK